MNLPDFSSNSRSLAESCVVSCSSPDCSAIVLLLPSFMSRPSTLSTPTSLLYLSCLARETPFLLSYEITLNGPVAIGLDVKPSLSYPETMVNTASASIFTSVGNGSEVFTVSLFPSIVIDSSGNFTSFLLVVSNALFIELLTSFGVSLLPS